MSDKLVALVSGASRGIGKAVALTLAAQGHYVVGTATSEKGANAISDYLKEAGYAGEGRVLQVSDVESRDSLQKYLKEGPGEPSILVNNAAITQDNLFIRMKDEEWENVVETNLTGVFHLTKLFTRTMMKKRWGRIINIGSVVGSAGNPGQANYCAAKAGVIGFSKSISLELASRGITVNVVAPGFIDTDMTKVLPEEQREKLLEVIPMGRIGDVQDIANTVGFLASEASGYITGQTIHVNGGMYLP